MKIARDAVVAIDYSIKLDDGHVVETSVSEGGGPLWYLHGRRQIVPGVERAIEGAREGEVMEVVVEPCDAYGERDPAGVFEVPRGVFPGGETIAPGMTFSATRTDGKTLSFHVLAVNPERVVIDTNHPLAGQTLHVAVAVRAVRRATSEEISAGRAIEREAVAQIPS